MCNNDNSRLRTQLDALSAYLGSFDDPNSAIVSLKGKKDPDSVRRHLAILINQQLYSDAVDLIEHLEPSLEWCDKAVAALTAAGQREKAREVMAWVKDHGEPIEWYRCILLYVEHVYEAVIARHPTREVRPECMTAEDRLMLIDLVEQARPVIQRAEANERTDNQLESLVLEYAAHASSLLRQNDEAARLAGVLLKRKPLPLIVAQLMLSRSIPTDEAVVPRLRAEHANSIEAGIIAAMIEGDILMRPKDAFESLIHLGDRSFDPAERERFCGALLQLSQSLGAAAIGQTKAVIVSHLGEAHRLRRHADVTTALATGHPDQAIAELDAMRDESDPLWLQEYASYLQQTNEPNKALEYVAKAAELVPHPGLLGQVASIAMQLGALPQARIALEKLAAIAPSEKAVIQNLAMVYAKMELPAEAARQFELLRKLDPTAVNALNAATAKARAGDLEASMAIYNDLCCSDDASMHAILGRAQLLRARGKGREAFKSLKQRRGRFWDQPEFVGSYLDLAFLAEEEDEGHQALLQLRRLQELGKASPDVLRMGTLEDLKQYAQAFSERTKTACTNVQQGKMPWLMADALLNNAPYVGWMLRTQDMRWVADTVEFSTQRCVYSTNSFVVKRENDEAHLVEIECPAKGTSVVMDLSSMITLQRLNLLGAAADYFGRMLYPSSYLPARLEEAARLVPHQPSRRTAYHSIKTAVDAKRIRVLDAPLDMPLVKEHTLPEDTGRYYRLVDVMDVLVAGGFITDEGRSRLVSVAHQPSAVDEKYPALMLASAVLIDLPTLHTLSQVGALEATIEALRPCITRGDYDEVLGGIGQFEIQEKLGTWHAELWDMIRADQRFEPSPCVMPDETKGKHRQAWDEHSLDAALLAAQKRMPLLVDDRVCQVLVLNQHPETPSAAFGTDRLVVALAESGIITWDQAASVYLRLMKYRYRFLVPPVRILSAICHRYRNAVPGEEMRALALYVHDCFRDAGLFCGLEPTQPPTSIAVRLYTHWVGIAAELVAAAWVGDEEYTVDQAEALTKWVMAELLPSVPRNMGPAGSILGGSTSKVVIGRVLIRLSASDDYERGNKCLHAIGRELGVSQEALLKLALEAINVI